MSIKRKRKTCAVCQTPQYLFSGGKCKKCWSSVKAKPINKISDRYKNILIKYKPLRKDFLDRNVKCQLNLKGCTKIAVCIHHKKGKYSEDLYLDENFWMASCINCNRVVEEIGAKAYELGLKIKQNGINN